MQRDLNKSLCGTDGALSQKQKTTEMSELISVVFLFGTFAFLLSWSISKFLWFFPSKERTEKRTLFLIFYTAVSPTNSNLQTTS